MEENRELEVVTPPISCAVCEHEVPLSEAVVPEAADYMVQFCGLDCYARWRRMAEPFVSTTR